MIVLDIIYDTDNGIGTKIVEFVITNNTIVSKNEEINKLKLWDYVGDQILEKEIRDAYKKQSEEEKLCIIISKNGNEGDYYTGGVLQFFVCKATSNY